ncbi:hypothetical protein GOP47_0022408 [Adiantum capillus-veneris]|uniref:Uncharacterized protein n=1 Tax=Adiantum capillus-veneris TaxID=13818 RepID=A0A9D4Z5B2_ADICA|nr:hypothetical protein GOP47_0022408 [Adiantum capillus-veneris]
MHASVSGGAAVGGPWGWDLNGLLLQLQGNESFGELDGAWNESEGGAVGTSDGNSSDMDDMEEFFEEHESGCLDAFAFASTRYFAFDRQTYGLMIASIESGQTITISALKAHDKRGVLDLKKWARMRDSLHVMVDQGGSSRLVIGNGKFIACIEDWESIVSACHSNDHLCLRATMASIACTWCTSIRQHGIPLAYVKEFLDLCVCASLPGLGELESHDTTSTENCPGLQDKQKTPGKDEGGVEEHTTLMDDIQNVINPIAIKHKARLVEQQSSSSRGFIQLVCHCNGEARRKGKCKDKGSCWAQRSCAGIT